MIASFRHKGLQEFFLTGSLRGINAQHAGKLRLLLTALHVAEAPDAMSNPGYRLHQLKGDRKGQWAVWVSGNWCSSLMARMPSMSNSSIITGPRRATWRCSTLPIRAKSSGKIA